MDPMRFRDVFKAHSLSQGRGLFKAEGGVGLGADAPGKNREVRAATAECAWLL